MTIRKTSEKDIPRLLVVFEEARKIMRSTGNMQQWTGGYPSVEILMNDISRGVSYVMEEDGVIVGTFAFIVGQDPTYTKIYEGAWKEDISTYGTIHRLASLPDVHGIAKECFDFCWDKVKNLRVDTHADNKLMQHVVTKYGFEYCGIIYLLDGNPRLAYQLF